MPSPSPLSPSAFGPEVVTPDDGLQVADGGLPEAAAQLQLPVYNQHMYPPTPELVQTWDSDSVPVEARDLKPGLVEASDYQRELEEPRDPKAPWWKRNKKLLWMLLALVCVLIILSVALGVVLGRKNDSNSDPVATGDNDTTTNDEKNTGNNSTDPLILLNIHPQSQLAVGNYTDYDGNPNRLVAYQDRLGCIMLSHYEPVSRLWRPVNVTNAFVGTDQSDLVGEPALAGTSIHLQVRGNDAVGQALAANGSVAEFRIHLFFVTQRGSFVELQTTRYDALQEGWQVHGLTYKALDILPGSSISGALTPYMDLTIRNVVFAQLASAPQAITRFIWRNREWETDLVAAELPSKNATALTVTPLWDYREVELFDGNKTAGVDSLAVYWHQGGQGEAHETTPYPQGDEMSSQLVDGGPSVAGGSSKPILASTSWGAAGGGLHDHVMLATLVTGSSLTLSQRTRGEAWNSGSVVLKDSPDGMAAPGEWLQLAFTQDRHAYALAPLGDGVAILEFTFEPDSPFTWNYVGQIDVE